MFPGRFVRGTRIATKQKKGSACAEPFLKVQVRLIFLSLQVSTLYCLGVIFVGVAFPATYGAGRPKVNFLALVDLELGVRVHHAFGVDRAEALFHQFHLVDSELLLFGIGELLGKSRKRFDVISGVGVEGFYAGTAAKEYLFAFNLGIFLRIDLITYHYGTGFVVCSVGKLNKEKTKDKCNN